MIHPSIEEVEIFLIMEISITHYTVFHQEEQLKTVDFSTATIPNPFDAAPSCKKSLKSNHLKAKINPLIAKIVIQILKKCLIKNYEFMKDTNQIVDLFETL